MFVCWWDVSPRPHATSHPFFFLSLSFYSAAIGRKSNHASLYLVFFCGSLTNPGCHSPNISSYNSACEDIFFCLLHLLNVFPTNPRFVPLVRATDPNKDGRRGFTFSCCAKMAPKLLVIRAQPPAEPGSGLWSSLGGGCNQVCIHPITADNCKGPPLKKKKN